MGRNQPSKGGGRASNKGTPPCAGSQGGQSKSKTADAATALGLGVPQQNTMFLQLGLAGLGMTQQNPLDSLFGSAGTNPLDGIAGLNTAFNRLLVGTISCSSLLSLGVCKLQQSLSRSVMFQPAQLLQVRQALAQQQATVVAAQQAEVHKRIEAETTKRAGELVKIEREKQKQKSDQVLEENATKQVGDDTTSRGSIWAGGRSQ